MNYQELAVKHELKDEEILFFTNFGVDKVTFKNVQMYLEDSSVYHGEEGESFNLYLAVTIYGVYVGEEQINNAFGDESDGQ